MSAEVLPFPRKIARRQGLSATAHMNLHFIAGALGIPPEDLACTVMEAAFTDAGFMKALLDTKRTDDDPSAA